MNKLIEKMVDERLAKLREARTVLDARTQEYTAAVALIDQAQGAAVAEAKKRLSSLEDDLKKYLKKEQQAVFGAKEMLVVPSGVVYRKEGRSLVKSRSALGWFSEALNSLVTGLGSWLPFQKELTKAEGSFIETVSVAAREQGLKAEFSVDWDVVKSWPEEKQIAAGLEVKRVEDYTWELRS